MEIILWKDKKKWKKTEENKFKTNLKQIFETNPKEIWRDAKNIQLGSDDPFEPSCTFQAMVIEAPQEQ